MSKPIIYCLGEILMRLETDKTNGENLNSFDLFFGGAEFNTIAGLAGLGQKTSIISIIPDNFLGQRIKMLANKFNIQTDKIKFANGNQGIYFVQKGLGIRTSKITYNRTNSVFTDKINLLSDIKFGQKGDWIHVSGITLSLSQETFDVAIKILTKAKEKGLKISFDFNYRSKLIDYDTAFSRYEKLLKISNLIFASQKDFTHIFKWNNKISEQEIFEQVISKYQVENIAFTNRGVSGGNNTYQGILISKDSTFKSKVQNLKIIDRIGGGDAFAAGIINGIIEGIPGQKLVDFATCQGAIAHSIKGDFSIISQEEINEFLINGNQDIKR